MQRFMQFSQQHISMKNRWIRLEIRAFMSFPYCAREKKHSASADMRIQSRVNEPDQSLMSRSLIATTSPCSALLSWKQEATWDERYWNVDTAAWIMSKGNEVYDMGRLSCVFKDTKPSTSLLFNTTAYFGNNMIVLWARTHAVHELL